MTTDSLNLPKFSPFNLSESESDITIFVRQYKERIIKQLANQERDSKTPFISFAEKRLNASDLAWLKDNQERFFNNTPNEELIKLNYLSQLGYITCMIYSPEGDHIIVGHSTGLIQMRHGTTGVVLATLRNVQFPPKPVYALHYSLTEERVCYAACMDGAIYRIEVPNVCISIDPLPEFCIKADPAVECLTMQFFGSPGLSSYSMPLITQRSPALCMGLTADESKIVVGYSDTSIKVYDKETQEDELTYKVHKLRLQFIPKKLQRMHSKQVCALRCHREKPYMFASGAWDKTLRIWDIRCKVGCVMTFEGVDVCSDSVDLNRDHCLCGSWQPTEALTVWDIVAKKKLNTIRVQNRRPDVDGEYIYACRYWRSTTFNRKGKYAIIGGSGTNCVEVINLHNRYITCSYPSEGSVLAVTSFQERIAFGGTAPVFNIVSFYDPKHEKYEVDDDSGFDFVKGFDQACVTLYDDTKHSTPFSKPDLEGVDIEGEVKYVDMEN